MMRWRVIFIEAIVLAVYLILARTHGRYVGSDLLFVMYGSLIPVIYFLFNYFFVTGHSPVKLIMPGDKTKMNVFVVISSILGGNAIALLWVSLLFVIMRWPGGQFQWLVAIFSMLAISVASLLVYRWIRDRFLLLSALRLIAFIVIGIGIYMLEVDDKNSFLATNESEQASFITQLDKTN